MSTTRPSGSPTPAAWNTRGDASPAGAVTSNCVPPRVKDETATWPEPKSSFGSDDTACPPKSAAVPTRFVLTS